jgi:hypothetical protein
LQEDINHSGSSGDTQKIQLSIQSYTFLVIRVQQASGLLQRTKPMKVKSEVIISGITLLVTCFLFYVASTFPQSRMTDQVGPALWPKIILLMIIMLSMTLLIQFVIYYLKGKKETPKEDFPAEKEGFRMLVLTVILSLLYGFGVSYVGFLLSILVFQTLFLLILKVRKIPVLVLYPLCLTIVIYAIFIKILYIPLPRGTGIFLTVSRLFY